MADVIVVKQAAAEKVAINQQAVEKVAVNPAPVTITGITLSPATNTTLGGIIVGDNLSINANGLLSAQAGGVYFPLNPNVTSGNKTIAGVVSGTVSNGTASSRPIYGVSRAFTVASGAAIETYIGLDPVTASSGSVTVGTRSFNANSASSSALQVSETRYTPSSAQTSLQVRYANGTINRSISYSATISGAGLVYQDATTFSQISVNNQGVLVYGELTSFSIQTKDTSTTYIPAANQTIGTIMNRKMCDERYAPFQKLN